MSDVNDLDFISSMQELLGMDEETVESLLDKLDADKLEELTDAVAKGDEEAAQAVVNRFNTDEDVNALFRGDHLDDLQSQKRKRRRNVDGDMQFAIGDDVMIEITGDDGKKKSVSATVEKPYGPEGTDTIVVKVKGKNVVVDKRTVDKLDEGVIGMIGMPNLTRIQQLAGIQGQGEIEQTSIVPEPQPEAVVLDEPLADDPIGQAMAALDTLEAALPNIILADLKVVRARLCALQSALSESFGGIPSVTNYGRARK